MVLPPKKQNSFGRGCLLLYYKILPDLFMGQLICTPRRHHRSPSNFPFPPPSLLAGERREWRLGGLQMRVSNEGLLRARRCGSTEARSEEHTSELQSPKDLVCRLLLEKKKK